MQYWRDGKMLSANDACASVEDRGYLLGDGIYETLLCVEGIPQYFKAHWERFSNAAQIHQLVLQFTAEQIHAVIQELFQQCESKNAVLRMTLTRTGGRGMAIPAVSKSTLLLSLVPYSVPELKPLSMASDTFIRSTGGDEWAYKAIQQTSTVRAFAKAQRLGFDDYLWQSREGFLLEASSSNVFFLQDNIWITPPTDGSILPGIMRATLIELFTKHGEIFEERPFHKSELEHTQGAFICNSVRIIQPIKTIDEWSASVNACDKLHFEL